MRFSRIFLIEKNNSVIVVFILIVASFLESIVAKTDQAQQNELWNLLKAESLALSTIAKQVYSDLESEVGQQLQAEKELCKITHLHGFQERKGVLPFENNLRKNQQTISEFLDLWHQKRHEIEGKGQGYEYVPPILQRSCHPMISHKYKFIYFGMPKTASRTTNSYFQDKVCKQTKDKECFQSVVSSNLTKKEYIKYYNEYFKFAFLRNPYSRAASVYFMIAQGEKENHEPYMKNDEGKKCAPTFQKHCLDPYKLKSLCGKNYDGIQTENNSSDCCCYVDENKIMQSFLDQHFMPQAPCILDHNGKITVDFIGRFEYFKEDLQVVIQEISKRSGYKLPSVKKLDSIGVRSQIDAKNSICEHMSNLYLNLYSKFPQCLSSLKKYYQLDFKLLQFDSKK